MCKVVETIRVLNVFFCQLVNQTHLPPKITVFFRGICVFNFWVFWFGYLSNQLKIS